MVEGIEMTSNQVATCELCCNPVTEHAYECIGEGAWEDRCVSEACSLGNCNDCADVDGNCCDCNCHVGITN